MNSNAPVPDRANLSNPRIEKEIRQRAYVLYEGRGRADGRALEDWLKAEEEVMAFRGAESAARKAT
jgi:hypothetical protein